MVMVDVATEKVLEPRSPEVQSTPIVNISSCAVFKHVRCLFF